MYLTAVTFNCEIAERVRSTCLTFVSLRRLLAVESSHIEKRYSVSLAASAETAPFVQLRAVHVRHMGRVDIL